MLALPKGRRGRGVPPYCLVSHSGQVVFQPRRLSIHHSCHAPIQTRQRGPLAWGATFCQGVPCLTIALSMVRNLCMQAVSATFLAFPAARRRREEAAISGLHREADSVSM